MEKERSNKDNAAFTAMTPLYQATNFPGKKNDIKTIRDLERKRLALTELEMVTNDNEGLLGSIAFITLF